METGEPAGGPVCGDSRTVLVVREPAERSPMVVAVDDAQWVDEPSLAWLGYLARRAADLPLLWF